MDNSYGKPEDSYLITGATGFIGGILTEYLVESGHMVTVLIRDISRCSEGIIKLIEDGKLRYHICDITDTSSMQKINEQYDYIIHLAAVTQSKVMMEKPVEVADGIVIGTRNILELAGRSQIRGMVYASSMEVYGRVDSSKSRTKENELGEVNLYSARSCYPMGKRMAEQYCYDYYSEYKLPVKVARLAQTFGTGISPEDNRVFMQFIKAVHENRNIVLKTEGLSYGNYCETMDAVRGLLAVLHYGAAGEVYNIVNEANTMRIREMADMVANSIAGGSIKVVYEIEDRNTSGYAEDTELRLSGEKLRKLGWEPTKGLEQMYWDMYEEYKKNKDN